MLQSIRDHTQGWIAGVIVSLLILSFALWGIHSYIGGNGVNDVVAKVNSTDITKPQLSVTYERMKRQLQSEMNLSQLPIQAESAIKERALQSLIETQVLKEAAIDAGYRISLIQSENFLQSLPEFQENGKFSVVKFQTLLESNLYHASDFLELIKTTLLIDQPRLGIILTSYALQNEIDNVVALVNQERDLEYAILSTELIKNQPISISESNVKQFYDQHQESFKTLDQLTVDYLTLNFADVISTIKPTDDALRQFYNETSGSYTVQEVDPNNKTIANKKTQNNQTQHNKAQDSKLVGSKVVSSVQPFEQVKDKVTKAYIQQRAEEKFSELREKLANITYEHPESLDVAAKELGLKIQTSAPFTRDHTRDESKKDLMSSPKIREAAFSNEVLSQRNNSDLVQVSPETAVVLRINTYSPAKILSLDTVKKQIIEKLTAAQQEVKVKQLANEIQQKLAAGATPEQVSTQYHLNWKKLGFVNRQTKSVDPAILKTAFSMSKSGQAKSIYALAKTPSFYAILAIHGFHNGSIKSNDSSYKSFVEQVQNAQGLIEYELYKARLLQEAKIKIEQ